MVKFGSGIRDGKTSRIRNTGDSLEYLLQVLAGEEDERSAAGDVQPVQPGVRGTRHVTQGLCLPYLIYLISSVVDPDPQ